MPLKEIKFYFVQGPHRGRHVFRWCSPGGSARWKNIISVNNIAEADYLVILQSADVPLPFPPERTVIIQHEPDEFFFVRHMWDNVNPLCKRYTLAQGYLQEWSQIRKSYDELKAMDFPPKTKGLSIITSSLGDGSEPPNIQVLTGHRLRIRFVQRFIGRFPDKLDLYGRRLTGPKWDHRCNKGQLIDKWDGLADYRYTLAFENSRQDGYFTETLIDPIFAGCMPIFWGCPNLEKFLPKGSFIRLDITGEDAPERAVEIVSSDFRERNIDKLRKAKALILDKYSPWPMLHKMLNELEGENASSRMDQK